jgi:hypothetical protein
VALERLGADGRATDVREALEDEDVPAGAGKIGRRDEGVVPAADDDDVCVVGRWGGLRHGDQPRVEDAPRAPRRRPSWQGRCMDRGRQQADPSPEPATREVMRWARLLTWAWGLVLVVCLVVIACSVAVIWADESSHAEEWDGLGTGLALWAIGLVAPAAVPAAVMAPLARRGRRRRDVRRLRAVAVASLVLVGVMLVVPVAMVPSQGIYVVVCLAVPAVIVGGPAWGVLASSKG